MCFIRPRARRSSGHVGGRRRVSRLRRVAGPLRAAARRRDHGDQKDGKESKVSWHGPREVQGKTRLKLPENPPFGGRDILTENPPAVEGQFLAAFRLPPSAFPLSHRCRCGGTAGGGPPPGPPRHDRRGRGMVEIEDREAAGPQSCGRRGSAPRRRRPKARCWRPWRRCRDRPGCGPSAKFICCRTQPANCSWLVGVVHGADEVEIAGANPRRPVLGDPTPAIGIASPHGRREFQLGPNLFHLAVDVGDQLRDLPARANRCTRLSARRCSSRPATGARAARVGLEPLPAAVAITAFAVRIANVVQMQAVDRVSPGHLQHAPQFEPPVFRVRRAEPIDRPALRGNLRALLAPHPSINSGGAPARL